jgi:hopanoid biosynthesis associated RND transporter like protein HpnN
VPGPDEQISEEMNRTNMHKISHSYRRYLRNLFQWWIVILQRNALAVIVVAGISTCGVLYYSVHNFALDANQSGMISEKLPFRKDEMDFRRAFPQLHDTIVVVIDADTIEMAVTARSCLAARLREEKKLFRNIYEPGGGEFFEKNGLLYLDQDQLHNLSNNLAAVQPLLALLAKDLSLRNIFSVLDKVVEKRDVVEIPQKKIDTLFDEMSRVFDRVLHGRSSKMSWQRLMAGEGLVPGQRHQFIIVQPYFSSHSLSGKKKSLEAIVRIAGKLGLDESHGVRVRLTGDIPLANENLLTIKSRLGIVILASFILVVVTLAFGVNFSPLITIANIITLAVGLVWTLGFAIVALGKFNLISITFAVIYIGVGIDFGLLVCLIYREFILRGKENSDAITATSVNVGKGLFLCMATEAIGFYAFVPTAYAGASKLGLICGTGMLINLMVNIIILPALLTLFPLKREKVKKTRISCSTLARKISELPFAHYKWFLTGAALTGLVAATALPRLSFDYNPMNLFNQSSEAVVTAQELFRDPETTPWTISVLVKDAGEARKITERLRKLKEVQAAVTIFDFVPEKQEEKLAIISDMALFMPPLPGKLELKHWSEAENIQALSRFAEQLNRSYLSAGKTPDPHAAQLYNRIRQFIEFIKVPGRAGTAFSVLESDLLSNLPTLLHRLDMLLQPTGIEIGNLPHELKEQYVAVDGRYRIQVFPRENITNVAALKRFVTAVRAVAPHATDTAVSIFESGNAVVSSFGQATCYALVAITLFLLFELRSLLETILILIPFALALMMTAASSVLLHVPLNFANIIVVPLLLGLGIDNGIHFIYRYRRDPWGNTNILQTNTFRAVFYNTTTSIVGFCTLIWMPNKGLSGMGIILTLCMTYVLICTVTVLPALIEVFKDRLENNKNNLDNGT